MNKYSIQRTDIADTQLSNIVLYVAEQFGVKKAEKILNEIVDSINLLTGSPYMGVIPKYTALRRQKFRVLILKKNLVFYKVFEETNSVMIYAIVNQRQDYLKIINGL